MRLGGVQFFVRAVNQERFFNTLCQKNKLFCLTRTSHTTANFITSILNEKQVAKALTEAGVTIEKQVRFGLIATFVSFFKRVGILAGLVFALALTIISQQFVFNMSIIGLEKLPKQTVETLLKQHGYGGFCAKTAIQTNEMEQLLLTLDEVSMASVMVRGNTLLISIKERVQNEFEGDFMPLKSGYDGLITSVSLVSGTLKVRVGQMVKKGDVLVEPFVFDSSGQKRFVKPQAAIEAKVWYVGQEKHVSHRVEVVRTGKKQNVSILTFLGIPLTSTPDTCSFKTYEVEESSVCISRNNLLPIYRLNKVFYETKQVVVDEAFESVQEQILQKAKQKTLLLAEECDIISKEYFNIITANQITFVEYVIEVQKRIDKEK